MLKCTTVGKSTLPPVVAAVTNISYALYQMGGFYKQPCRPSICIVPLKTFIDKMLYHRGISICIVVCMSTLKLADTVSFSEDPLTQGRGALSREGSQRPSHMLLKKQQLRNFVKWG